MERALTTHKWMWHMKPNNTQSQTEQKVKDVVRSIVCGLRQLTSRQIGYNIILPYPFLLLSWWFASQSWYVLACGASYLFFAAAFRQAHDGYHHSLGAGRRLTTAILLLLSVLLMTSFIVSEPLTWRIIETH